MTLFLTLLACVPDLLTVTPSGDGSYGVGPSEWCCFISAVLLTFACVIAYRLTFSR